MKKKKLLGKIVSLVLAAALTVTALPTTGIEVQAAEQVQTETEEPETAEAAENNETSEDESSQAKSEEKSDEAQSTEEEKTSEAESEDEKKSSEAESKDEKDTAVDNTAEKDPTMKSPVIADGKVKFNYFGPDAKSVKLAGDMTGWQDAAIEMQKSDTPGYWSTEIENNFKPGVYKYKFIVIGADDKESWTNDELNPNPERKSDDKDTNTELWIEGLAASETTAVRGKTTELPQKVDRYTVSDAKGSMVATEVTYALSEETSNAAYKDSIVLTEKDGVTSVELKSDLPTDVTSFTLTSKNKSNDSETATVTVKVVDKEYKEDPNVKSPVVGKGQATFNYFAPDAKTVEIKGEMTGWSYKPMTFNAETGYWSITLSMTKGTYQYGIAKDGVFKADPLNLPTSGTNSIVTITENADEVSPVIEGNKVTFKYEDATAEKVALAGSMNEWDKTKNLFQKESETSNVWTLTLEDVKPGQYTYKFVVGENGWMTDPLNSNTITEGDNTNSVFWIEGLADGKVEATSDGSATELPKNLKLWTVGEDGKGTAADAAVTYALSAETEKAEYKDLITLTPATESAGATISLKKGFPAEDVKSFTLTAKDADNHTATVTVDVVAEKYTYTIYYYDKNHTVADEIALWIWENGGAGGKEFAFTGTEELKDGNVWMKAVHELSYVDFGFKAKSAGSWAWEGVNCAFVNKDKAKEVTLYIIADDNKVYTELPEIVEQEERYLIVEYKRDNGSAKDWYFYTWNSGFGANVYVPFEEVNGSWIAKVPVKPGLSYVSYCIERANVAEDGTANHWAEKDGNDYNCSMPEDQTVVKIIMEQDLGITKTYPYNVGYELAPKDKKIHFYYRDNNKFLAGETDKYESVAVEINGKEYPMTFDKESERYTYDLKQLDKGTYKYRYVLQETKESEKIFVLDRYNTRTEKDEATGTEYSVVEYGSFDAVVEASVYRDSMDYNDNNVLTITLEGKKDKDGKEADISGLVVAKATADLSALGGSSEAVIDPELRELTISVKQGISAGEKVIPVTIYDQFQNEYLANTTVIVTERNKGGDFDWDEAVIYFAVTDRFFDGNESNNGKGYDKSENGSSSYHGGDFAGLTQKLDYLKDLGVNTIWITPIVANDMEDGLNTDVAGIKSWGYHGYWASDFEKLDSHLGTEQEFATLLSEAHNRGIKIMVDVVLNHSGYETATKEYFNTNFKDADGNPIRMLRNDDEVVPGSDQKKSLSDLPDFLTENAEVRELLVEWQSNWISKYPIDYYRVDTVKHVDDTTWSAFKNALTKINPKFKMIGEWAGAGYATDTGALRTGRMDSLLDFDFNNKATDFVTGNISGTEGFLCSRNGAIDNTATLGQFIGSHDEDGFVYHLYSTENEGKGLPKEKAEALGKVAASLQITAKGQPVIYYGEEIGLTGANNYPYQTNRYDFDWSKVTDDNKTLTHYKKLLAIRNQYSEVFAKGSRTTITASNDTGIDVFARSYNGAVIYTALNINDSEVEYTFTGLVPNSGMKNIYSGEVYTADKDGKVVVKIPAAADGGTAILVKGNYAADTEADTAGFWVDDIAAQTYTGKAITIPADQLKVYFGQTLLTAGIDYTVKYSDNKNAGTATITVKGKGNYDGSQTVNFIILPKSVEDEDVVTELKTAKVNGLQKPTATVTYNKKKLAINKDYEVVYYKLADDGTRVGGAEAKALTDVAEKGSYEMLVKGKGNFTGEISSVVSVSDKAVDLKKVTITLEQTSYDYTGSAITPKVTVTLKDKAKTPVAEDCYTVEYKDNINAGTAKAIITGIPAKGYFGTVTKTFKINGEKLSSAAQINGSWMNAVDYDIKTGKAEQPASVGLVLKTGDKTPLKLTKDYTVSYQKNTKPGTATMIFTGTGKYTGVIKKNFKVNKITFSETDARLWYKVASEAPYGKKGAKASVLVSYNGITLTEGKDYKLSYKNNKTVGSKATVTITGAGDFTGKLVLADCYKVVKADLSTLNITANDVVFVNKAGKFMSAPVITDASGAKLANNKDYTLKYYLINADGTETEKNKTETVKLDNGVPVSIKVVATANGNNYVEGTKVSAVYRVVPASIATAKVTVKAQVYTGKAITLKETDFTQVVLKDGTKLTYGKDFEIVEGSYVNNIKKGTASVTIKGIGNYGGTRKVTFKITSRTMAWWWNLLK